MCTRPPSSEERRLQVLLAEDNLVNQRVTRAQLTRLGCDVDLAADGREAIGAITRRRYDLVFMDCQMPEVDGFDAARENDGAALRGAAHSVKGSAGIVGAEGMASLCRRLELLADEGQTAAAETLIASLTHEHEAVMSVLREAVESV